MIEQRLKELRFQKNLTQNDLASILGVAKTTLAAYEQSKNQPSIETITKIANYFNVSTDYLLGLTDVQSPNFEISYISKYLGLTEHSIKELHFYNEIAQNGDNMMKQKLETLNLLFAPHCELLSHITNYLNFYATHYKNFYDNSEKHLTPIAELELWDDIEKVGYSDDWDMWSKALLLIVEEELLHLRQRYLEQKFEQAPTD